MNRDRTTTLNLKLNIKEYDFTVIFIHSLKCRWLVNKVKMASCGGDLECLEAVYLKSQHEVSESVSDTIIEKNKTS